MNDERKPYILNDDYNFDERLLLKFSEESSIPLVTPLGRIHFAIKLQQEQEPCVYGIGYPAVILRYILKDYMKEDYSLFLDNILQKIWKYEKFINKRSRLIKQALYITLENHYTSIKHISSFGITYHDTNDISKLRTITDIIIVFEGESCYEKYHINEKVSKVKMIINYNDINGFFLNFFEAHRHEFSDKLGIKKSTDLKQMITLIDMLMI